MLVPLAWLVLLGYPLAGQLAPVGTPKGSLRFEIQGAFQSADRRLLDGHREDYLADFGSPALGSDRVPLLVHADTLIGQILDQPGYRLNLGRQRARGQLTIGTGIVGISLGVTRQLTLFSHIPFVNTRVQTNLRLDSTSADAGFNPAHPVYGNQAEQNRANQFFSAFDAALQTLDANITAGFYTDNATLALAQNTKAQGDSLRDELYSVTLGSPSPFLPTGASPTGQQIIAVIRNLQSTLETSLSVTGFSLDPVLASNRLTDQDFTDFLSNPLGPIAAFAPGEAKISRMGDMDVGTVLTLVDRFDRPEHNGGFRLALSGLLRLPTGTRDNPNNLVDVGTGNGRYEVGVSATADLGRGRIGLRASGGFLARLASLRVRRVAPPSAPYAEAALLKNVQLDAGDIVSLGIRPYLRLARNLALHGQVDYSHTAADQVQYDAAGDAIPGVPASVMAEASRKALALGGGLSYVGRTAHECERGQRCGWPIEAGWSYTVVSSGSGGRTSQFRSTSFEIRWYQRLWR